jgi:hypothetical protein
MTTASVITRTGHRHIDTDTQARAVLDRMALDFERMVKRTDVDYYIKQPNNYNGHGNGHGCGRGNNGDKDSDQIAFFSQVPGYYPTALSKQSPICLVAYRVNQGNANNNPAYGRLERMAKGLGWNAFVNNPNSNDPSPVVFFPQTISSVPSWSAAISNDNSAASRDADYEIIGPEVFRLEYYYVLKNGRITDWPWDRFDYPNQTTFSTPLQLGLSQIEAIVVSIAVIDPASRALIQTASSNTGYGDILDVAAELPDFKNSCGKGGSAQKSLGTLEDQWESIIQSIARTGQTPQGKLVPREAAKGIRVYSRAFDLRIW